MNYSVYKILLFACLLVVVCLLGFLSERHIVRSHLRKRPEEMNRCIKSEKTKVTIAVVGSVLLIIGNLLNIVNLFVVLMLTAFSAGIVFRLLLIANNNRQCKPKSKQERGRVSRIKKRELTRRDLGARMTGYGEALASRG